MVVFNDNSFFPVISNIFYIIPLTLAFYYHWFYLGFIYLFVIITSTTYHICENLHSCLFSWEVSTWRSLDHIFAWFGICLSLVYVFNPEIYRWTFRHPTHGDLMDTKTEDCMDERLDKRTKMMTLNISCFTFMKFFFALTNSLILIEIVYFSTGMVEGFPIPQAVIFGTVIFAIIILRFIIVTTHHKGNLKHYCSNQINPLFMMMALIILVFAVLTFLSTEDANGILHGLWHFFGALTGGLVMLSLYN
jgi:hypothetical protein